MTKVLDRLPGILLVGSLLSQGAFAQSASTPACPRTATALYSRLNSIGLDEHRVHRVRGATIDRPNLHIVLDSGTIAFTEDVCGHTIGALFEGEGEILLRPPNKVERQSLALFTGTAILEEQFSFAYFGFNDDTPDALRPFLSDADDGAEFVKERNESVRSLAEADALRFLLDFSHSLPTPTGTEALPQLPRLLHSRIQGNKLGMFEVFWDEAVYEPVWAGQV